MKGTADLYNKTALDWAEKEYAYSNYWEKCWNNENVSELTRYLSSWNGTKSDEMDIFINRGIKKVCDAACGFGAHTIALLSNGFDVEAFDISQRAVELTVEGLKNCGYGNVSIKVASILNTGYEDETFDAVTAYAVIDHLTKNDAEKALQELMRIAKTGGLVLMSFDKAQEDDFDMSHSLLDDGSMLYEEGTPNGGMIFHPYEDDEIMDLGKDYRILLSKSDKKGSRIIILEK